MLPFTLPVHKSIQLIYISYITHYEMLHRSPLEQNLLAYFSSPEYNLAVGFSYAEATQFSY